MLLFLNFLNKNKSESSPKPIIISSLKTKRTNEQIAARKGELGEYKIDIQLDHCLRIIAT
jgi:hypothetical protein